MGAREEAGNQAATPTGMASSYSSSNTTPAHAPPPPMPPPPYFKTHFINPSSFKSAVNSKLDKPLISVFYLSVRILQLVFALASGISYGIELSHGNGQGQASGSFVFSQVAFGATLVTLIFYGATVRYYRISWIVDWILAVFWFAIFAVFYNAYFADEMEHEYSGVNLSRMERAVWCDLINALLWSASALFASAICCSGIKASIKRKIQDRKQRKQKRRVMETMSEMEMGTV